jgi:ABC-type uncharacterized transport system permease subunit
LATIEVISSILGIAIASGTVIVLAALGELLAELTGVYNMGTEGTMAMGAVTAILVVHSYPGNVSLALLLAMLVGFLMGALFAIAAVIFKADQVLSGLAVLFIGTGLSGRLGVPYAGAPSVAQFQRIPIPILSEIPHLGETFFNQTLVVYIAYLILPVLVGFILYRTRHGMNLRAVGENPAAAEASGISVTRYRFTYVCIGAALAGAGGAYLTLALFPTWQQGVIAGRGWIALALVIFARWKPQGVILGSLLFGGLISFGFVAQARNWGFNPFILSMLPYLVTITFMILTMLLRDRTLRRGIGPASLGSQYFKEEG